MGSGRNRKVRAALGSRTSRRSNTKLRGAIMTPGARKHPDGRKLAPKVRARVSQSQQQAS